MASVTQEQLIETQGELIRKMQQQIQELTARMPPPEPEDSGTPKRWPRLVWKQAKTPKSQIDHPGSKCREVIDQEDLDHAIAEGWREEAFPSVYPPEPGDVVEEPAQPAKRGKS